MKKRLREIWQENKTVRYTTATLLVLCLLLGSSMLGVSGSNGKLVSKIENLQEEKTSLSEQLSENRKTEEALRSRLTLCIQQKMSMARETSAYEDQQDEIEQLSTKVSELRKKNSTLTSKNKTLKKQLEKSKESSATSSGSGKKSVSTKTVKSNTSKSDTVKSVASQTTKKNTTVNTTDEKSKVVYVTETGECYHCAGCQYLRSSCIETTLEEAESDGYRPCSRCCP